MHAWWKPIHVVEVWLRYIVAASRRFRRECDPRGGRWLGRIFGLEVLDMCGITFGDRLGLIEWCARVGDGGWDAVSSDRLEQTAVFAHVPAPR
jgi:hypothetical protein